LYEVVDDEEILDHIGRAHKPVKVRGCQHSQDAAQVLVAVAHFEWVIPQPGHPPGRVIGCQDGQFAVSGQAPPALPGQCLLLDDLWRVYPDVRNAFKDVGWEKGLEIELVILGTIRIRHFDISYVQSDVTDKGPEPC
jgi:hypothetical protein